MNTFVRRIILSLVAVGVVIGAGGLALEAIGRGRWTLGDGLWMSTISAATVGFSELPGMRAVPGARLITVAIILLGVGAFAVFQSSLTAFFIEGVLGQAFRRRRMDRQIAELNDHVVVAGCGSTGRHVVAELLAARTPFVVIDRSRENVEALARELGERVLFIIGDATHDQILLEAGLLRARGLVAALTHDRDNVYVTLSARTLNPRARIVAKVVDQEAVPKMTRAGANATVSPNTIGGLRLASEILRPSVVAFLDAVMRDKNLGLRIEEVDVPSGSPLDGKRLCESGIHETTNALVIGARDASGEVHYNPRRDFVIHAGTVLMVLGGVNDMARLRAQARTAA